MTAAPAPDRPVELDLRALTKAEDQLAQEEAALAAELTAVQNTADRLAQRIEALDQGMTKLRLPRHERMSKSLVPEIDVRAPSQRGLSARAAAVSARYAANRELRELIQGYKQMLQRVSPQVAQGEAVLEAHQAEAARRAEAPTQPQVAAAPLRADPTPPVAPPPLKAASAQQQLSAVPPRLKPVAKPAPKPVEGAPEGVSRRAQTRVAMQAQVDLQGDSNLFSGFSTNLSEGGLFVATVNLLPLGTEVDLAFTLAGGETIKTHAVVRWRREVSDLQPDQMPGLGLQFVDLDEAAQKAITAFIEQREPLFWAE